MQVRVEPQVCWAVADDLQALVAARLRRVGQRLPSGRRILIDALARADRPVTTGELVAADARLPQSTTYRNLALLEQVGVVHRVIGSDEFARFELAEEFTGHHHHHLVCVSCGTVEDFEAPPQVEKGLADAISASPPARGSAPRRTASTCSAPARAAPPERRPPRPRAGAATRTLRSCADAPCHAGRMTNAVRPEAVNPDEEVVGDPSVRLARYVARTEIPLDLLALATLWIVLVPPGDFGPSSKAVSVAWTIRVAVSVVYGIDLTIRCALAERHVHYFVKHPLVIASVIAPPVRVVFSIRLVRSVFRKGNLRRFLVAASVMVLNGALIVFLYERHAPNSNIHTVGDAIWWSFVTVTTVGYGDFYPVTPQGRVTACFIMGVGLLTLAVLTAQVASSFVAQSSRQRNDSEVDDTPAAELSLPELHQRLERIEALIVALSSSAPDAEP